MYIPKIGVGLELMTSRLGKGTEGPSRERVDSTRNINVHDKKRTLCKFFKEEVYFGSVGSSVQTLRCS